MKKYKVTLLIKVSDKWLTNNTNLKVGLDNLLNNYKWNTGNIDNFTTEIIKISEKQ